MTATPPQPPTSGGIAGLVAQALAFIDKPWKGVVVLVALVLGGIGWVLYEHSDEFVESWLTPVGTGLKVAEVAPALDQLITGDGIDLVQVWSVDLAGNSQKFVAARAKSGERPVIPNPRRLPVIVGTSDIKALLDALEGHPVCLDLDDRGAPMARRLAERGYKRGCAIPIPPTPDQFFAVLYLAWVTPPDASSENVAITAAREIAGRLVMR